MYIGEDGVLSQRHIGLTRHRDIAEDGIRFGSICSGYCASVEVAVHHRYKTIGGVFRCFIYRHLLDRVINIGVVEAMIDESLIIDTEYDMRDGIVLGIVHAAGVGLVGNQRRFGSEDAYIVDDEVVAIEVGCLVVDTDTELVVTPLLVDREEDLIPFVGRLDITRHVGSNIVPGSTVVGSLYRDCEVRVGFAFLTADVSYVAGEVHLLSFAEVGTQCECCHLTGRRHTVAVDHIAVFGTAVLLKFLPPSGIRNTVDQRILTRAGEVFLIVITVVGDLRCYGVGITIRTVCPWQRVRIDMIVFTGLYIIEVQSLQHLVVLLNLIVGDERLGCRTGAFFFIRTVLARVVVDDLVAADIEPIQTIHGGLFSCHLRGRFALCA